MGNSESARLVEEKEERVNTLSDDLTSDLTYTLAELKQIKASFLTEMKEGWIQGQGKGATPDQSSLKMITSHINILPTGKECGVFFAVDLGGTNLRILRVNLDEGKWTTKEHREPIPSHVISKNASASDLFDFIANACGQLCNGLPADCAPMPLGFTFSFPYSQSSIRSGTLIEWTKGFETAGCVGEDPAALLQAALDRHGIPLTVDALCNDTVGTLMTNAYTKKSTDCRVGVILGTGTNAAYSDPELDNLIVNIEWGGFDKLPRRTEFDIAVDKNSPNAGKQFLEKMVSGLYLGELARLATISELARKQIPVHPTLLKADSIETSTISHLLAKNRAIISQSPLSLLDDETLKILSAVSELVVDRSAAIAAAALAAVVDKASNHLASRCEVGIDGSLYTKGHEYKSRLVGHLRTLFPGKEDRISLDFSEDGSGLGAALVAAAIAHGRQVSLT